jgi:hypothetical protein
MLIAYTVAKLRNTKKHRRALPTSKCLPIQRSNVASASRREHATYLKSRGPGRVRAGSSPAPGINPGFPLTSQISSRAVIATSKGVKKSRIVCWPKLWGKRAASCSQTFFRGKESLVAVSSLTKSFIGHGSHYPSAEED